MNRPLNSSDIEFAVANHFDWRQNLIVPNIWWGLGFNHELDMIVLTQSRYAYEIEIKTSVADLKKDLEKSHMHFSDKIRKLFFAIPKTMENSIEFIPADAGIIIVNENLMVQILRRPKINKNARSLTEKEMEKLFHLAAMRVWNLKKKLREIRKQRENIFSQNS